MNNISPKIITPFLIYTIEDLKCRFYTTKNIQGFLVTKRVNYEFVKVMSKRIHINASCSFPQLYPN
jgi:hypothetical protein